LAAAQVHRRYTVSQLLFPLGHGHAVHPCRGKWPSGSGFDKFIRGRRRGTAPLYWAPRGLDV
jgi:hypothetical protein